MPFYSDITQKLRVSKFSSTDTCKNIASSLASSLAMGISSGYRFFALQTTAVRKIRQDNTCLLEAYFKSSVQIYRNKHETQTSQFSWKHDLEFSLCVTSLIWNICELFLRLINRFSILFFNLFVPVHIIKFVYARLFTKVSFRTWSFFPTIIYIVSKPQLLHGILLSWATVLVTSTLFCAFYTTRGSL